MNASVKLQDCWRMPEAFHRSVTEIAFACGFNDASHFGRVFAAKMHMTPSQWRQRKH